ncbi:MAG: DUF177 domain-containing protein [Bacteroidaceae bacterium]|jgi:uncharacterized metal-binding protein YceD (DUF177 family)|nr:DUF177 domain-containing protein [Bacteroidaceae bacterium]
MGKLDGYKVDLKGMATDTVSYRWQADNDFFSAVQGSDIKQGLLDVALRVKRTSGAYELEFQLQGEVEVTCDRCLESMNQPIDAFCTLRVVMGEDFVDDGDVVVIPEREGVINVAWNIYEFAALQIPLRHVHPDCEALSESSEEERVDPRWADLKKLINSKQ